MKVEEIQIAYSPNIGEQIKDSDAVIDVLRNDWPDISIREKMKVLFLNRGNRLLGVYTLSSGGISGTIVDMKLLFSVAVKTLSSAIILAHNHPSGNNKPSESDITITRKVRDAGNLLDISVLDHVIITKDAHYSLADNGEI